ncbi:MAG: sigma-70 family RNA polymerase sigma factor [Xanthomonadales bacterium]|nr:sigma-70 family RNA polymerase sigma factor [Xanthomonadales bacterium]
MTSGDITDMLREARGGTRAAIDALMPVLYEELRRIAQARLAGGPSQRSLNTTGLVHEVYLRLIDQSRIEWPDRLHFYGYAATAMRHILVDQARRRHSEKRGGREPAAIATADLFEGDAVDSADWIYLDQALEHLRGFSPRLVQVVELRVFAGLTAEEVAELLDLSLRTVRRDWHKARLILHRFMRPDGADESG